MTDHNNQSAEPIERMQVFAEVGGNEHLLRARQLIDLHRKFRGNEKGSRSGESVKQKLAEARRDVEAAIDQLGKQEQSG